MYVCLSLSFVRSRFFFLLPIYIDIFVALNFLRFSFLKRTNTHFLVRSDELFHLNLFFSRFAPINTHNFVYVRWGEMNEEELFMCPSLPIRNVFQCLFHQFFPIAFAFIYIFNQEKNEQNMFASRKTVSFIFDCLFCAIFFPILCGLIA